jgi:hypothetical protein
MDLVYSIPLLGLLALAWIALRRVAKNKRTREALRRRKRRSRANQARETDTVSQRSDMRATDSPISVSDTIRKRSKGP